MIILNTIDLALYKYPISKKELNTLEYINYALTFAFVAEMVLKLIGFGFCNYIRDYFNIFDCIVVVSSVIDFIISVQFNNKSISSATALRAFRLIRIFKLARTWTKLKNLLKTMLQTLKDVSTFSILLLVFLSIYTLLGMELFAYQLKFNDTHEYDPINGVSPRRNFDTFINSFISIFIILTNDGWAQIFYDCYRSTTPSAAIIFFLTFILIGQRIMLNLFLAILLENFDEHSLDEELTEKLDGDE